MAKGRSLIVPIQVNQLGCPERCIFCDQNSISGKKGGLPSRAEIQDTINDYLRSWKGEGKREVAFYGGSFTSLDLGLQASLLDAVQSYVKNGEIDSLRVSTRPDAIDEASLELLSENAVKTVELGVQSMDLKVLKLSGRRHIPLDVERAAGLIKGFGMQLGCQLMPGLPGDDRGKSVKSATIVSSLGTDMARIYPAVVIKGTAMEMLYSSGEYFPLHMDDAVSISADMMEVFEEAGVEVIRVGLQHEASLQDAVIAGPYHPSFGEMVKSELFFRRVAKLLNGMPHMEEKVVVSISPYDESAFRGLNNSNMEKIMKTFPGYSFELSRDITVKRGNFYVG
ncbi:MAG: radical SAM protein [bacterium]|nr:radical SAM protein [bacterium]